MMTPCTPPTREEMNRAIEKIIQKADLPQRRFLPFLWHMLRDVGLYNSFRGVMWAPGLCLLLALLGIGGTSTISSMDSFWFPMFSGFQVFLLPALLTGISLLVCLIEKYQGVWDIRAVCRYNDKYLLAVRMLCMGLIGLLCLGLALIKVQDIEKDILWRFFLLSAVSYFLCGTFLLLALRLLPEAWFWPCAIMWGLLSLCLTVFSKEITVPMLLTPMPVIVVGAIGAMALYIWQVRQSALSEQKGGFFRC